MQLLVPGGPHLKTNPQRPVGATFGAARHRTVRSLPPGHHPASGEPSLCSIAMDAGRLSPGISGATPCTLRAERGPPVTWTWRLTACGAVSQGVSCKASGRGRGAPVQAVLGRTRRHGGGQPRRRSHGGSRHQGRSWGHGGRRREGVSGVDAWVAGADVDRERRGSGGARRRLAHRLRAPTSPWSASETGR